MENDKHRILYATVFCQSVKSFIYLLSHDYLTAKEVFLVKYDST